MTDKQPVWKDGILWVWSDLYQRYIANYSPFHYWRFMGVDLE